MKQSDRTVELRHALVTTADAAPYQPRISRRRAVTIASIAAFALGGVATGGAVATAAIAGSNDPTAEQVHYSGEISKQNIVGTHADLFGDPFNFLGEGTTSVDLGAIPPGATALAFGLDCVDSGNYDATIDGVRQMHIDCTDASIDQRGGGGGQLGVEGSGPHTLVITGSGRYIVWAQWAAEKPIPPSSEAQAEAMADGIVTREEYVAGFDRYVACMAGAGYHVDGGNRTATLISYSIVAAAVDDGTDQLCYDPEYKDIDMTWQIAHVDESETTQLLRDCLTAHGVTPAYPSAEVDQQLKDNGIDPRDCLQ